MKKSSYSVYSTKAKKLLIGYILCLMNFKIVVTFNWLYIGWEFFNNIINILVEFFKTKIYLASQSKKSFNNLHKIKHKLQV